MPSNEKDLHSAGFVSEMKTVASSTSVKLRKGLPLLVSPLLFLFRLTAQALTHLLWKASPLFRNLWISVKHIWAHCPVAVAGRLRTVRLIFLLRLAALWRVLTNARIGSFASFEDICEPALPSAAKAVGEDDAGRRLPPRTLFWGRAYSAPMMHSPKRMVWTSSCIFLAREASDPSAHGPVAEDCPTSFGLVLAWGASDPSPRSSAVEGCPTSLSDPRGGGGISHRAQSRSLDVETGYASGPSTKKTRGHGAARTVMVRSPPAESGSWSGSSTVLPCEIR